jgi:hypothetical protein
VETNVRKDGNRTSEEKIDINKMDIQDKRQNKIIPSGTRQEYCPPGVDYSESFAPVASDTSMRVMIEIFLYYHHRDKKSNWEL